MMEQMPQLVDFDVILETSLKSFILACEQLDPQLLALSLEVKNAFIALKDLIIYGLTNPEPGKDHHLMLQYKEAVNTVVVRQSEPPKELMNHFATIREVAVALNFMIVRPAPTPFIRDMIDCSQYYANRVLTDFKGSEKHQSFIKKIDELFTDVLHYVKKHYQTGFTWNSVKVSSALPPPPPPPPAFCDPIETKEDGARIALLNELNKGSEITRHLKPVKRSEHATQPKDSANTLKSAVSLKPSAAKTYPPKFQLEGRKWIVEHQKDNYSLVINNESMSESVACYKMENSSVTINNKINNLVIDNCCRSSVSLTSVIACVELIRCERMALTCFGVVPLINLENCDSVQLFLSEEARNVEIISAKCSSCNVCLLNADGTYVERPIQEQIKTLLVHDKLVSTVIEKN